jgi:hypothetical protein
MLYFKFNTIVFHCREPNFQIKHQTLYLKRLTPCSAAEGHRVSSRPAQTLKPSPHGIYATVLPSAGAGVRKIARHYHDFILDFKHNFYLFREPAFCSFTICILPKIFFSNESSLYSLHVLAFLCFLNGGNLYDWHSVPRSQHVYIPYTTLKTSKKSI